MLLRWTAPAGAEAESCVRGGPAGVDGVAGSCCGRNTGRAFGDGTGEVFRELGAKM